MLLIENDELVVDILDPASDHERLGTRYCHGGYVWQVRSRVAGPLFTGPQWPSPTPTTFNGQGLPESFRHHTRGGQPLTWKGDRGIAVGIGELARNASGEIELVAPCTWSATRGPGRLDFHTVHSALDYHYDLVRTVHLADRTLTSTSQLTNLSDVPLELEWFAHPFFALTDRLLDVRLPEGTSLKENPGYTLTGRELRFKRRFEHERDGHMDLLQLPAGAHLAATLSHPVLEHLELSTDFSPSETVIWGNDATFSIEPYRRLQLPHGRTETWSISYRLGRES
ncbi:MAG: hypothetical protein KBA71_02945 [Opitutaceae bacterium]|nr:hypothetical protein [Opitutaceae bacterium]